MLLLFDIDGTLLIRGAREHALALHDAIEEIWDVDLREVRVETGGRTDPEIAREILVAAGRRRRRDRGAAGPVPGDARRPLRRARPGRPLRPARPGRGRRARAAGRRRRDAAVARDRQRRGRRAAEAARAGIGRPLRDRAGRLRLGLAGPCRPAGGRPGARRTGVERRRAVAARAHRRHRRHAARHRLRARRRRARRRGADGAVRRRGPGATPMRCSARCATCRTRSRALARG